jgi:putative Mg2+ transporter-C (MgtC) family protein
MLSDVDMILRIASGTALGGVIGYERDRHRRPVGLRTHTIVAMAAATFMVVSSQFVYFQHYAKEDLVNVDTSRIAASVVSGIGFLAGGAILRQGLTIQGLTTAAGLWLVTAIGMSSGAGMFAVSAVVTGLGITALTVLRRFEDKNDLLVRRKVSIVLGEGSEDFRPLVQALASVGAIVSGVDYQKRLDDENRRLAVTFDVQMPGALDPAELIRLIEEAAPGVRRVKVEHQSR